MSAEDDTAEAIADELLNRLERQVLLLGILSREAQRIARNCKPARS